MTRTVCLIPGWGMRSAVWKPLADALGTTHTLRLVEPGVDGSPYSAEAISSRIPEGSVVIGWSLGGQMAMQLAIDHPARVERLVLVGTTPSFIQRDDWPHGLPPETVAAFVNGFSDEPAQTLKRFVALQGMGDADRRGVTRALTQALQPLDDDVRQILHAGLRALETNDLRADVVRINCPVRLFHGDEDALMPVGAAHWLADHIEGAQLTCFAECGHAPFLSRPEAFALLTRRFIDG